MAYNDLKSFFDIVNGFDPTLEGGEIVIILPDAPTGQAKAKRIRDTFGFETVLRNGDTRLSIKSNTAQLIFFLEVQDFWKSVNQHGFEEYELDIGILYSDTGRLYFDKKKTITFVNEVEAQENKFFTNVRFYLQFLKFLEEKSLGDELKFRFVDDFDWNDRQVIFSSLKKEGRLAFEIPQKFPSLPDQDLHDNYESLVKIFTEFDAQMYHPKFVKSEIIERFSKPTYGRLTTDLLFYEINDIRAVADQNLAIFMADLSIDKIKKDFLELKTKYFGQFREIVSKLSTQIIALPISISATAIATYNTKDSYGVAWFVLFAFLIYSIFASYLLKNYREDLEDIGESLDRDYTKELNQQYLKRDSDDYSYFSRQQWILQNKIKTLKRTLYFYFGLQTIGHAFIIWIVLNTLSFPPSFSGIAVIFFALVSLFFFKLENSAQIYPQ